jgi:hypothetical protein
MRIVKTPHDYTRELEILASETHSNTFDHCMNVAVKSIEVQDIETALFYLDRAIQLDPNYITPILKRAKLYPNLKQYDDEVGR